MKTLKILSAIITLCLQLSIVGCLDSKAIDQDKDIESSLIEWLSTNPEERTPLDSLDFALQALTKSEAEHLSELLLEDKTNRLLNVYGAQWNDRSIKFNGVEMPFYYNIFGPEPSDGRSLYISMHGGGGTTAANNDQQYENQKHLYDATMKSLEGVYLAPRAPTNTWNLWHQDHIDELMNLIIQLAVIKENVNPNKVYLLGYSAGGDGVYQLAPRMADRWAAASMMAGHPNDASPLGLRNTPFAIHVGELDTPYERNLVARQWGDELEDLQRHDPKGYIHEVKIHTGLGHWMKFQDSVALVWMKQFQRNPIPEKVVWKQDDILHPSLYWLGSYKKEAKAGDLIVAEYNKTLNEINILENSLDQVHFFINDDMLNLDKPVTIKYQGETIGKKMLSRSILNIYNSLNLKGDLNLSYSAEITVFKNKNVR